MQNFFILLAHHENSPTNVRGKGQPCWGGGGDSAYERGEDAHRKF